MPEIHYYPAGYDPTINRVPPRQARLGGMAVMLLMALLLGCVTVFVMGLSAGQSAAAEQTVTVTGSAEATVDDWGATGTALYWETFTPTATLTLTPTATLTPTLSTPTLIPTIDNWQATGTAIWLALNPSTATQPVQLLPATTTPRYSSRAAQQAVVQPAPQQPQAQLQAAPQQVIITAPPQQIVVTAPPIVITATQEVKIALPTFTATPTPTETPTPSPTIFYEAPTATATQTPPVDFTSIPSATPLDILLTNVVPPTWTVEPPPGVTLGPTATDNNPLPPGVTLTP